MIGCSPRPAGGGRRSADESVRGYLRSADLVVSRVPAWGPSVAGSHPHHVRPPNQKVGRQALRSIHYPFEARSERTQASTAHDLEKYLQRVRVVSLSQTRVPFPEPSITSAARLDRRARGARGRRSLRFSPSPGPTRVLDSLERLPPRRTRVATRGRTRACPGRRG